MILLLKQGVREPVAGYKRWQELRRQVEVGAVGKLILHTVIVQIPNDDGEKVPLQEHIDTTTSGGKFIFHIFGALTEFEREVIKVRTNAGL